LHRLGLRYRKHVRLAKGCTPDLVFAKHRLALFVDGCFWHECPEHGRTAFTGPNALLWREKMARNKARDIRAGEVAAGLGYSVLRVWECAVMRDPQAAAEFVIAAIRDGQ
jgi:DNA mismatch endonuclease (patch repair protein)